LLGRRSTGDGEGRGRRRGAARMSSAFVQPQADGAALQPPAATAGLVPQQGAFFPFNAVPEAPISGSRHQSFCRARLCQRRAVGGGAGLAEAAEDDAGGVIAAGQRGQDRVDGDLRGAVGREAVDAGADGRDGDAGKLVLGGDLQAAAIARGEQRLLVRAAAAPDRADRVDDVAGGEAVAPGDLRLARRAAAERAAFRQKLRPGGPVNGAVDPAAAEQRLVRGINDGVNREPGDVALDDLDAVGVDCRLLGLRRGFAFAAGRFVSVPRVAERCDPGVRASAASGRWRRSPPPRGWLLPRPEPWPAASPPSGRARRGRHGSDRRRARSRPQGSGA